MLIDRWFWGSFYHSMVDIVFPSFLTAQTVLPPGVVWDVVSLYDHTLVPHPRFHDAYMTLDALSSLALGRPIRKLANMSRGSMCYSAVVVGFAYGLRPVHYPAIMSAPTEVMELTAPSRAFHFALQRLLLPPPPDGLQDSTDGGGRPGISIVFATRSQTQIESSRTFSEQLTRQLSAHFEAAGLKVRFVFLGSLPLVEAARLLGGARVLVGLEGADFVNQFFMPLGSALMQIHTPKGGCPHPCFMHTLPTR